MSWVCSLVQATFMHADAEAICNRHTDSSCRSQLQAVQLYKFAYLLEAYIMCSAASISFCLRSSCSTITYNLTHSEIAYHAVQLSFNFLPTTKHKASIAYYTVQIAIIYNQMQHFNCLPSAIEALLLLQTLWSISTSHLKTCSPGFCKPHYTQMTKQAFLAGSMNSLAMYRKCHIEVQGSSADTSFLYQSRDSFIKYHILYCYQQLKQASSFICRGFENVRFQAHLQHSYPAIVEIWWL